MSEAEATNAAYEKELQEASAADLTLVRGKQVVHVVRNEDGTLGVDSEGSHIVMLTPSLIPNDSSAWEKAFKLFLLETQEVSLDTKSQCATFANHAPNGALRKHSLTVDKL